MNHQRVLKNIETPGSDKKIILYDLEGDKNGYQENLECVDEAGTLIWKAKLPDYTSPNSFVEVRVVNNTVLANTWSGHLLTIDINTGKTLNIVFTK